MALGVTEANVTSNIAPDTFTFLPRGPVSTMSLDQYRMQIARPPQQPVLNTHRFSLEQSDPEVRAALI